MSKISLADIVEKNKRGVELVTLQNISDILDKLIRESAANRVPPELALRPELAGMKIFRGCLVGCADASDRIFPEMKADFKAYGDMLRLPGDWLPGAKSVVAFFCHTRRK